MNEFEKEMNDGEIINGEVIGEVKEIATEVKEEMPAAAASEPYTSHRKTGVELAAPTPALSIEEPAHNEPQKAPFFTETVRDETKKRRSGKFKTSIAVALIVSVVGGSCLGLGIGVGVPLANDYLIPKLMDDSKELENFSFEKTNAIQPVGAFTSNNGYPNFVDIIEKVEPSVVTITSTVQGTQQMFNFSVPVEGVAAGSGILFKETSSNYYIATNCHVIEGASTVYVCIGDSEGIPAKLVGKDQQADLAVISIAKADVTKAGIGKVMIATFGDSENMQVGEIVLAIGNAMGEGNTATNGIISAKNKQITVEGKKLEVLQTNAAINQGNSGGALVNLNGEVIGINTAKFSETLAEGMGYSIPSDVAKPIIEGLMTPKPMLGIRGETVSEKWAAQFNLPQAGVFIGEIIENSAAERAGLQTTDIITGIDDQSIFTWEQLVEVIAQHKVGDKVSLKVIRDGKTYMDVDVKLTENNVASF